MSTGYKAPTGAITSETPLIPVETYTGVERPSTNATNGPLEFLISLSRRFEAEDQITDRLQQQKWLRNSKFYEGEHLGRFDSFGQWRSYQPQLGDPYFLHPDFRFHSDAITASWTQSRPDVRILPATDDDVDFGKARKASQILDHYEDTLLTEDFLQREGKLGQFTGQMYRFTWWDHTVGREVPRYEFETQNIPLDEGHFTCPQCGYLGIPAELAGGGCPQCGAPANAMQMEPPTTLAVPTPKQTGTYHIGDIRTETVPAFQIKIDRSGGTFDKANWMRRRRMLRVEIVQELFPWYKPSMTSTVSNDFALRAERLLQQSTGATSAWRSDSSATQAQGTIVNQWWLAPCIYSQRPPEWKDLEFADGRKIPAGTRLIDVFPHGLYYLIIDNHIMDMRDEYLHDHWQHSPFILIPGRPEGDGIEDLIEPQRELDDLMSLAYIDAKSNAAPNTLVNTTMGVKPSDIMGKPHYVAPVRVPTGEHLSNGVMQLQGRGMPASFFRYIDMLKSSSQLYAKSFSSATGAPDQITQGAGIETATGAQLATSAAQQQRGPELAIRAAGNVVWAKQVLKLFQRNAVDEHYIPMQGRYGLLEGKYFKGADIDADFIFSVRPRSWIPRDEFSRRSDLLGFINAGGLNPQLPRTIRDEIAEVFNVDITVTNDVADLRLARMRLDQMKQAFQQLDQSGINPIAVATILLQAVPIEPESDNHAVMVEYYKEWLKTDEGLMASPVLRQTIVQRIKEHKEAAAQIAAEDLQLSLVAQGPMLQMQAQQAQAQAQAAAEADDKKHTTDLLTTKMQADASTRNAQIQASAAAQQGAKESE